MSSTPRIDTYKTPHIDFPDQKILGLLAQIDWAIKAVKDNRVGPYGAMEHIISAVEDFCEEWNG